MAKSLAILFVLLATFSRARSACDDIDNFFGDLGSVEEINLDVPLVECLENGDGEQLEEILIESGKTLTITSSKSSVQFVNLRFTVEDGASLFFDLDLTLFGGNSGDEENAPGYMLDVKEGGSATFVGDFHATDVKNVRSVFYNAGSMEFKGDSLFDDNGNVFRSNVGTLKFRGDSVFKGNRYLAIDNEESGFVRFSKSATFDDNASSFDGAEGCAVSNDDDATVIFRGVATFDNHRCTEAPAVGNSGKMRFYGKTYFNDNINDREWGGGVKNSGGTLIFKASTQFNRNEAVRGGGIAVTGGEVIFKRYTKFEDNIAEVTGGAFSVTYGGQYGSPSGNEAPGLLTFEKPEKLKTFNNVVVENNFNDSEEVSVCDVGYVQEEATVVGVDVNDECVEN